MAQNRVVETILAFKVDEPNVQRANSAVAELRTTIERLKSKESVEPIKINPNQVRVVSKAMQALQADVERLKKGTPIELVKPTTSVSGNSAISRQGGGSDFIGKTILDSVRSATSSIPILGDAVQNLGVGTEQAIGRIATSSPLAVAAIVAVGAGFALLDRQLQDTKNTLNAAVSANEAYYDLIGSAATEEKVIERREELNRRLAAQQEELSVIEASFASAFEGAVKSFGEVGGRAAFAISNALSTDDEATARADELRNSVRDAQAEIDALSRGLENGAFAAATAAEAERKLAEARARQAVGFNQDFLNAELEAGNLAVRASVEAVEERIAALQREQTVLAEYAGYVQRQIDNAGDDVAVREALQAQLDGINRSIETATNTLTLFNRDGLLETVRAAEAAKEALEAEQRVREESINLVRQYEQDKARIEQQAAEREIALAQQLSDQQLAIAERAAEQEADLLEKLVQARDDLAADLATDLADAAAQAQEDALNRQIDFQRQEVESAIQHQADLERIRRSGEEREFELALNRDFAGLARSRRQTASDLTNANQQFGEDRAARARAFQQQNEDAARQYDLERNQRIARFQQDVVDAEVNYQRERTQIAQQRQRNLQEAQTAYNRELLQLRQKLTAELAQRQQAVVAELRLVQQGTAAKLALEQQYYAQSQRLIQQAIGNLGGSSGQAGNASGFLPSATRSSGLSNLRPLPGRGSQQTASAAPGGIVLNLNIPITTGASADQIRGLVPAIQQTVRTEVADLFGVSA
jgi:hypothetical protein